jgi:putative SOS response-associated peptidase YedK
LTSIPTIAAYANEMVGELHDRMPVILEVPKVWPVGKRTETETV